MALSTFSGPVRSNNGFQIPVVTTANLPAFGDVAVGTAYIVSDNGALLSTQARLGLLLLALHYLNRRLTWQDQ
jgi:hypothetical protein